MELFAILPAVSGVFFLVQSLYYGGLYTRIYTHNRKPITIAPDAEMPALSVIVLAKDAADVRENLPYILEQDYPSFEVIVVYDCSTDDCDDTLKLLEDKYPHLYHTFVPHTARYVSHKKLAITMGIKASRHEWLVFTESDCRPHGKLWLRHMARRFTPETDIVLGYSNYQNTSGWFNKKITFDGLLNAMRYLGMAISGHPYMGIGRNLAYRKSLYYKQKGFSSHLNLQRGEDDLFVNEAARKCKVQVETSPESVVRVSMPKSKKIWREEKISYMATSSFFKGMARYVSGFETCSRLLFYVAIIVTGIAGILYSQWMLTGIAVALWILRFVMQLVVFRKTSLSLGEQKFYFLLPLFDLMQPLWNVGLRLRKSLRKKDEFFRK